MTGRILVVESDAAGLRAALVVGNRLEALEIDRVDRPTRVGEVTIAKASQAIHGLGMLVKLGQGPELLLERGRDKVQPAAGDRLTVQIARDPRGEKLGVARREIALAGPALVHLPFETGIMSSRRLRIGDERLQSFQARLAGYPGGWVLRRRAGHVTEEDFDAECKALAGEGESLRPPMPGLPAPDAFRRLAADYGGPSLDAIQVAGAEAERSVMSWCAAFAPSLLDRIERHAAPPGLFDQHDLDSAIGMLSEPRVPLAGGGSLMIERTEALTAIDVNSGRESSVLAVNLTAASEISRQLRLRHIGGIIVVDFISMNRPRDRDNVTAALAAAMADDAAQTHILPMSPLGLIEMTRERRGPELEL